MQCLPVFNGVNKQISTGNMDAENLFMATMNNEIDFFKEKCKNKNTVRSTTTCNPIQRLSSTTVTYILVGIPTVLTIKSFRRKEDVYLSALTKKVLSNIK